MPQKLNLGDIVSYVMQDRPQPRFMMWNSIEDNRPTMEWSPFYWKPGDSGVIVDACSSYVKILKFGNGCGWIMKSWASKLNARKKIV
jgi:hypothetical protein